MNYLFDTCVVSEVIRPQPDARVLGWLERIPQDRIHLSVLTLGELRKGILRLSDTQRAQRLQLWLDTDLRDQFRGRLLPIDAEVALEWGRICADAEAVGRPRPTIDALLAATAVVHHLTLVTRNTSDVAFTRADVFNPWDATASL